MKIFGKSSVVFEKDQNLIEVGYTTIPVHYISLLQSCSHECKEDLENEEGFMNSIIY